MSIYATLWTLKFPKDGNDHPGCEWITVMAQGVPPHIGSPAPGAGYEAGDPYAAFLPPPVRTNEDGESAYAGMTFETLYARICDALRGNRPRMVATFCAPGGRTRIFFENGTSKELDEERETRGR